MTDVLTEAEIPLMMGIVNNEEYLRRLQAILDADKRAKATQAEAVLAVNQMNDAREELRQLHASLDGRKEGLDAREDTLRSVSQGVEDEKRRFEKVREKVEREQDEIAASLQQREDSVTARETAVAARERDAEALMTAAEKLKADYGARHAALHAAMQVTG